uniref:NADH-ubiquinone oxidoreductase chain 4 n=1 Tax=Pyrhila pisum TaxID=1550678 RepID=A0A165TXD0_PYRPS|nr:NADH dehydrogenase subunit 4 [Pyrhila pisum]AMY96228.1 NADH dehydrogenase subunit 4 [Pyrhila pisum]
MLKLIIPLFLLIKFYKNWNCVQLSLFILGGMFMVNCFHDFYMYEMGVLFGMDYISYIMVALSVWIVSLSVLASHSIKYMENSYMFILMVLFLLLTLVFTFSSLDYLLFYISFEGSLIFIFILIMGWGYQPERIQAGIYMLFYTLAFSLPLLLSLVLMSKNYGSLIGMNKSLDLHNDLSMIWYICSVMAFLVKMPMYMLHLWLPKAHVEAPLAGSMILAGVLLKLGGYGLIRVLMLFEFVSQKFSWLYISLSLVGGFYVSLICLRQVDIKSIIAYSSVVHMGLVICGIMIFSMWGVSGAVIVMIGHGLCSSGLFYLANVIYERLGSRSLLLAKGWLTIMPSMGLWWFLMSVGNMASPPTLNLAGEIMLMISLINWSKLSMYGLGLMSFFSACYTLYLYSASQHGVFYKSLFSCCSGKVSEYICLFLHWFPLNVLILNMNIYIV